MKVWNVKVNDCWFDNTVSPNFQLNYWTLAYCKDFRFKCRKHNQLVLFEIDPEIKERNRSENEKVARNINGRRI